MLDVVGLRKRFGDTEALRGVSFSIKPGDIIGLIGPNGAGKTTLLECLAGLQAFDGGSITWEGELLTPARRKHAMFYMPHSITPYGEQAVSVLLGFFRDVFGQPISRERELVTRLALAPVLGKRAETLSKGYQRRLLLALGLLAPQPLLLLDEPFDSFDLRQALGVMSMLNEMVQEGRTFLLSIHQLGDAQRACDRFLLLLGGRLLAQGTLRELQAVAGTQATSLEEVFLALT